MVRANRRAQKQGKAALSRACIASHELSVNCQACFCKKFGLLKHPLI
jgi:hypothetical protein